MDYFAPNAIRELRGPYYPLSNFARVSYRGPDGIVYPGVEWGFQAAKSLDLELRANIAVLPAPGQAKAAGRSRLLIPHRRNPRLPARYLVCRSDWDQVSYATMYEHKRLQLQQNRGLAQLLVSTGDAPIYEGNGWNDTIWGCNVRTGHGENRLGKIYMQLRTELRTGQLRCA